MLICRIQWLKTVQQFLTWGSNFTNITPDVKTAHTVFNCTFMLPVTSNLTFLPVSNTPHFIAPSPNLDRGQNLKKSSRCIVAPNALHKCAKWWSFTIQTLGGDSFWKKRSKCNPGGQSAIGGVQKLSHMLVPMKRLKLPRDEHAAFAYLFCMGVQKKITNFWPRGQN